MFSLFAVNACSGQQTAADKEKCNPQCDVVVISRLRRFAIVGQFRYYGVCLSDLFRCRSVLVILAAAGAIPVFDIALGGLGRRLGWEVLQIGMAVRSKCAVFVAAILTDCLILAGSLAACMLGECCTADVAHVVCVFICVSVMDGDDHFCPISRMVGGNDRLCTFCRMQCKPTV